MRKITPLSLAILKVMTCAFSIAVIGNITGVNVFASNTQNYSNSNTIPQILVEEKEYQNNGGVMHEYIWQDSPLVDILIKDSRAVLSEDEQMEAASWSKHEKEAGTLKHRAAKISPNAGSSAWYACAETDYPAWHYSRAQIVKRLTGKVLQDSNQVQVKKGIAIARTPKDKLYLLDWDFSMRSYWGT